MIHQNHLIQVLREIERRVRGGASVKEACRYFGLSRSTFYRRRRDYRRYLNGDTSALDLKSRAPKRLARKTPAKIREEVIRLAQTGRFRFASEIAREIQQVHGHRIHRGTVASLLEEEGLFGFRRDNQGRRVSRRREVIGIH